MKRSQQISLGLVPIVAAAFLAGCEGPQRKTCVDKDGRVVADANCEALPASGASGSWDGRQGNPPYPYHWYWYHGSSPILGSRAPSGGGFSAPAASSTARGGFGSTAAGHSSGS